MKISIKTLQGKTFQVDAEMSYTIAQVKTAIETSQGEGFAVAQQKLIHSGKVLKDDVTLEQAEVKENGFLVCMITKPKAAPRAASSSSSSTTTTAATAAPSASPASLPPITASSSTPSTTEINTTTPPSEAGATTTDTMNPAAVRQLCDMGFPEDQVHAALRAAFNNADRAVEYLMNGIPENLPSTATTAAAPVSAPTGGIEAFRQHPQFDQMRRMVQSNPAALPTVLQQIGTQNPEFLRLIHGNQEEFVRMMNEPVTAAPPSTTTAVPSVGSTNPSPAEMMQMFQSMPPEQRQQMATAMGMSPEQLQQVTQMMANMPPEALSQLVASMGGSAGGGAPGGGAGAPNPGVHQVQLTDEEMAAVTRLCDMGFDQNDVIQAYLACEKNEALAANFLMDMGN